MTQLSHLTPISLQLINGLRRIQATNLELPLVPLNNNKQPLGNGWQHRPFSATQLIEAIENGGVKVPIKGKTKKILPHGFGVITGRSLTIRGKTHFLLAIDLDGASAHREIDELSSGQPLPQTVSFTSGRPGRCQYLFFVPEEYADAIKTKKIKTGVIGDDGKAEQLEFRWQNLQSVLPPSVHPTTGEYHWVDSCAIDETEIAIAPHWLIEQMLVEEIGSRESGIGNRESLLPKENYSLLPHSEIDYAKSYLDALSSFRADDYDDWLTVGMALHSVDDSLLVSWDQWSQQSAKYKPGDCEKKWRSFSVSGGVTLGTLAQMAKRDGWQNPFAQNKNNVFRARFYSQSLATESTPIPTVTGDTPTRGDNSKPEILDLSATVATVTTILKRGLPDYFERNELDSVQIRSSMSKAAFWQLVGAIRTSLDEIQPEDTNQFEQLIDWHSATLDFYKILPQPLAETVIGDAAVLNIDPISLWQYFLPAVLSLAGRRVNLDVESHSIPAIAWTCIVGESGTGKSRAESLILGNLKQRQHREKQRWLQETQEYQQNTKKTGKDEQSEIELPTPERKYLFEVATIQAVMRRLSEQHSNGSIWARDEIAGLFKSLGQFQARKGDHEGLECLLKMWDGSGSFVDRVNAEIDSYAVPETRLSIAGGIQPGAFRTAFSDPNDAQGLQARFLYAIPKVFPAKRVKGYCQLSELLPPLYDWLDRCPVGTIKLSKQADRRYSNLVEQIGLQAEQSSSSTVRAWMRKLPTQLLRIALGLHLVECYYDQTRPFWELQLDTLERAVEVCRYYRSAFAIVQEKVADSDNISSMLLKIWDMAATNPSGVTPRDIYRSIKAIGRRAKEIGRSVGAYTVELLSKLVQTGKGKLEKNGRSFRFFAAFSAPKAPIGSHDGQEKTQTQQSPELDEFAISPPTITDSNQFDLSAHSNSQGLNTEPKDSVTEVTNPQNEIEQTIEASPSQLTSPVTTNNVAPQTAKSETPSKGQPNRVKSENLNWLLQFLADLEATPSPHRRFTDVDRLVALFHESEQRASFCYEELLEHCSDYFERLAAALLVVSESFS